MLLLPDRYARVGHMTQRLFEAVLAGCLPITPTTIVGAHTFTPTALHATSGQEVIARVEQLRRLAGTPAHADLLAACLRSLDQFRLSHQLSIISHLLEPLTTPASRRLTPAGQPSWPARSRGRG